MQSFLREINGTKDWDAASASALRQYVPKSLTASVTPSRAGGGIGGGAVGGYVAFGLTYAGTNSTGGTEITASYLVVMDLYGNISRVESACVGARALSRAVLARGFVPRASRFSDPGRRARARSLARFLAPPPRAGTSAATSTASSPSSRRTRRTCS